MIATAVSQNIPAGRYVIAVSGGVDSMVLLHILASRHIDDQKYIVAHFDHGIRTDSVEDRRLVQAAAQSYELQFVYDEGNLGPKASEATARAARYQFLESVKRASLAVGIITAHHQDDLIETALLNILRGTNRRGITSLSSTPSRLRPLLAYTKQDLLRYAKNHNIQWREDSTNADQSYRRNHLRHTVMPRLSAAARQELLNIVNDLSTTNAQIDTTLNLVMPAYVDRHGLDRAAFAELPQNVARELLASWLRANAITDYDAKTLHRLVAGITTLQAGKHVDILHGHSVLLTKQYAILEPAASGAQKQI